MCYLPAKVAPWCAKDHKSASCVLRELITISNLVLRVGVDKGYSHGGLVGPRRLGAARWERVLH